MPRDKLDCMDSGTNMIRALFKDGLGDKLFSRLEGFSPDWNKWNTRLFALLLLALIAHFGIYAYSVVKVFPFPYQFKGWAGDEMMYNSWLLSQGQNFYVDPAKEVSAAYPYNPGFQFLAVPLVRIFGPRMWVGRLVAISGLVLTWALMFRAARKLTGKALYGLIAVGLLMATYGAMDAHFDDIHPDSWVVVFGLLSLALAELALKKPAYIVPAALAAFLSFFFKQPGISFGAGAACFLFLSRPRYAAYYLLILAALVTANFAIGQALTGGMYWDYTVVAPRGQHIIWIKIPASIYSLISAFKFTIIFLLFMVINKPTSLPLSSAYAVALPFVFFLYGSASVVYGGGTMSNFFPATVLIAILLACALRYVRAGMSPASPRLALLLLSILLAQNLSLFTSPTPIVTKEHYRAARQVERIIRSTPGEVLVFYRIAFAYLNGKRLYDNLVVEAEFKWRYGGRLESQLQSRYFERVISPQRAINWGMWGRKIYDILYENYEVETVISSPPWFQTTPMVVLKRKSGGQGPGDKSPASPGPAPAGRPPALQE
ncbi:MAG TPA: glycosyltransferase family 39 protein [bacterium]|nr:glycosyltransferase family 39 protein [bacterium]